MAPGHLTQTYQPLSIGTSVLPTVGPLTSTTPALETVLLATGQQSRLQAKGRIMPAIPSMINAQQDIDCEWFRNIYNFRLIKKYAYICSNKKNYVYIFKELTGFNIFEIIATHWFL